MESFASKDVTRSLVNNDLMVLAVILSFWFLSSSSDLPISSCRSAFNWATYMLTYPITDTKVVRASPKIF